MKRKMNRITSFLIVVAMLFSLVPTVFANPTSEFVDFPTGWSYEAMTAAVNNGLLVGYEGSEIRPQANLTRAEMATIITRSFGAKTTASIAAYTDVSPSAWYYDYIAKAVKMEVMQGVSRTEMNPEAPITREEVFTIFARVLVLEGGDAGVLNKFPDAGDISSWAKDSIIALAERGYVNGDHLGYANPKANITREEFAQLMHNAIRSYITKPGTYTKDVPGITVIRVGDVHLKNFTNTSDLVVGDGAMLDSVIIEGITIEKRLLARGGTITVKRSTARDGVVVKNVNNVTPFKNYRDEPFFKGIVEKTPASFLQRTIIGGGTGSTPTTKKYELTLMINGQEYDTIKVSAGRLGNDLPGAPDKKYLPVGYEFVRWLDENGDEVTKDTKVKKDMILEAELKPIDYQISFKDKEGKDIVFDGFTPNPTFNIENAASYVLPQAGNIVAPQHYEFKGWVDKNGNPVTELKVTASTTDTVLTAVFEPIPYTLTYSTDQAIDWEFADGSSKAVTVTIEDFSNSQYVLKTNVKVNTAGYHFVTWLDENGDPIAHLTPATLKTMTVKAYFAEDDKYTVTFENYTGFEGVSWSFKNGDPKTATFTAVPYTLPGIADVTVTTADYEFIGWVDANGNPVTSVDALANTTVYANFRYTYVPPTQYAITFKNHFMSGSAAWSFKNSDPKTIYLDASDFPYTLPSADDLVVDNPNYRFVRWYDTEYHPSTEITVIDTPQNVTVYAYIRALYSVTYKTYTPNVQWEFKAGYTAPDSYYMDEFPTLPTADNINVLTPGYRFAGWVDGNGNPLNLRNGDWEVYASFESTVVPSYTVTFENYTGFENVDWAFNDGTSNPATFTTVPYELPEIADVTVTTADYEFIGWVDATGRAVLTIDTLANTTVYANFRSTVIPPETVTVTFYRGYGDSKRELVRGNSTVEVEIGTTIPEADIPVNNSLKSELYDKDADLSGEIASIYVDEEPYIIKPTYWYEKITRDENDVIIGRELVSYDKDVIITKDITEVYVLYQAFMLMFEFNDDKAMALSATANYTEDTRLMDSLKTLLLSGRDSYNLADSLNKLPEQYEKAMDLAKEKLVDAKVLDENDNIQILYIPIRISSLIKEETANDMVKQFIRDAVKDQSKLHYVLSIIDLEDHGITVPDGLSDAQIEQMIRNHLATLNGSEKTAFADQVFANLKASVEYKTFMNSLMNKEKFALGDLEYLDMLQIVNHTIRDLTYEEAIAEAQNATLQKILDTIGEDFLKAHYEDMRNAYCDGLDKAIERVRTTGRTEYYSTSLTLVANVVEMLDQLYAKAQPIVVEKLSNRNVKYNENIYVKHLVEGHDIIASLFDGDASLATDTLSGYTLKGVLDYYNYMLGLLFVADDALLWYGDDGNLSQDEFDAVYDAIIGKALIAHEKLNEILEAYNEDGTLPAQVQKAFDQVQKLNDLVLKFEPKIKALLDKYFASDLNGKLENGIIPGEDKILTFVDILLGQEDPVFTIDSVYEIFYRYDDKMQAKLQQLIDSGKLEQAIEKFETTEFGNLFRDNKYAGKVADKIEEIKQTGKVQSAFGSIYDLMQVIAKEGIEPFRINEDKVNVRDAYQVTVGGITFTISRDYQ